MRAFLLALAIGVLLGGFGLRIAQNLGFFVPRAEGRAFSAATDAQQRGGAAGGDVEALSQEIRRRVAEEPAPRDLSSLAVALENAKWDGDWLTVEAAALAIRQDGAAWMRPPEPARAPAVAEPVPGPRADAPLFARARELERGFALVALENRRNQATKLLGRSDRQSIATLIGLFGDLALAPAVRADAALVLALSGDAQGIEALTTALRAAEAFQRRAAAEALAFVGSRDGAAEMATLIESGPSEAVMLDATRGLGLYDAAVMGEPHTATEALLRALSRHHLAAVRAVAAHAFADSDLGRASEVRQALATALRSDADADVRAAAAETVRRYTELAGAPSDLVAAATAALAEEREPRVLGAVVPVLAYGDAETLAALQAFAGSTRARDHGEVVAATLAALRERVEVGR